MAKKKKVASPLHKQSKPSKSASKQVATTKRLAKKEKEAAKTPATSAVSAAALRSTVSAASAPPTLAMAPPPSAAAPSGAAAGATQVVVTAASLEVVIHKLWGSPPVFDEMRIEATDSAGKMYKHHGTSATLSLTKALLASLAVAGWQLPWQFKATGWRIDGTVP